MIQFNNRKILLNKDFILYLFVKKKKRKMKFFVSIFFPKILADMMFSIIQSTHLSDSYQAKHVENNSWNREIHIYNRKISDNYLVSTVNHIWYIY